MPDNIMQLGAVEVRIEDPQAILPVYADLVTEARVVSGVVYLSLAAVTQDANGPLEGRVVSRLRLSMETAQVVANLIAQSLEQNTEIKKNAN